MDFGHGKKRSNDNNIERVDDDRLSSLPNGLIHKILSYISTKDTVKTIALSSRYRFIWTTMPFLNLSTQDFPKLRNFSNFITQVLSRRNSRIDVSCLKIRFHGKVTQPRVKKLMNYAFSHNIQQLDVECIVEKEREIEFPLSLFSCQSLKHLSLKRESKYAYVLKATSTLELPALTTLCLCNVTFSSDAYTDNCVGFLSNCPNLKNLTLKSCEANGSSSFSICHLGLSDLTLDAGLSYVSVVNVVAPQLENLTIRCGNYIRRKHVISAPNLASLAYRGTYDFQLSTDGFHCLKKADICVSHPITDAHPMVSLLQQLYNVKFLKLSFEIIELLSSSVELISRQASPFVNLKSLTIYPERISEWDTWGLPKGIVNLSTEVKNYLLDSSPGATFTMFSREEVIAEKDFASARRLMAELQGLLEQEKADTSTKGKAPTESDDAKMHKKRKAQPETKMQLQIEGDIALSKSCFKDHSVQLKQRKAIILKLESIDRLLKKLPATNRAMIEPCVSKLSKEVVIVTSKVIQ